MGLPHVETSVTSPAATARSSPSAARGRRAESLVPMVDKRNHTFGRLCETGRRGRVLGNMQVSFAVGDLAKLKRWTLNSTIDPVLADNPEVKDMTNVVSRASKYCIICEKIARKI